MIVFRVTQSGAVWKVTRDDRLICFFDTVDAATDAAEQFASNCLQHGKEAKVLNLNSPQHEHRGERQFEY